MDIVSLMNRIYEYYKDNNFEKTIREIDKYLQLEGIGIFDNLLNIYIECQIRLGLLDKAYENVEILRKLFPKYYSNLNLVINYSRCCKVDRVSEMLSNCKFGVDDYYDIACNCLFNGNKDKAKELFNYYILVTDNKVKKKQAERNLRLIRLYENNGNVFEEMKYSYFKSKGYKLKPGYVVYVDRLRNEFKENKVNTDNKCMRRPYMIWRIIDNKIYAFPISTQIRNSRTCILRKENYPARNFDRVVKNEVVCLEERDVYDVIDKIRVSDYDNIIRDIYFSICMNHNIPKETTEFFMNMIKREMGIKVNDIIIVPDSLQGKKRYYYVIDFNSKKQKYKVIEVLNNGMKDFEVIGKEIINISVETPILNVIKLDVDKREKILEKISSNLKKVKMGGKIVSYGSKKLEIMIEEDDCYICLDRTFNCSSSFMCVEFIKKDIPLTVVGKVSNEEYQKQLYTLKRYIVQNFDNVYTKKKVFLG